MITREAKVRRGKVHLRFYWNGWTIYFSKKDEEFFVEIPGSIVREWSQEVIDETVKKTITVPEETKIYFSVALVIPADKEAVKRATVEVTRAVLQAKKDIEEKAQKIGLDRWLWEKAMFDGRWRKIKEQED